MHEHNIFYSADHNCAYIIIDDKKNYKVIIGLCYEKPGNDDKSNMLYAGYAFSGCPLARLEILVGDWNVFQWSPTRRLEIKLTILWL